MKPSRVTVDRLGWIFDRHASARMDAILKADDALKRNDINDIWKAAHVLVFKYGNKGDVVETVMKAMDRLYVFVNKEFCEPLFYAKAANDKPYDDGTLSRYENLLRDFERLAYSYAMKASKEDCVEAVDNWARFLQLRMDYGDPVRASSSIILSILQQDGGLRAGKNEILRNLAKRKWIEHIRSMPENRLEEISLYDVNLHTTKVEVFSNTDHLGFMRSIIQQRLWGNMKPVSNGSSPQPP